MADVKKILDLWFKLRDTPKDLICVHEISRMNPWDYSVKRDMEQAFELDPDGLTALLLLDNFRNDFFDGCGLSITDILENPNFGEFMRDCKRLKDMLSDEEIVSALKVFMGSVSTAVSCMEIDRKDVSEMLESRYDMAILRRDALKSMKTLSLHQFYQGETKAKHLTYLPDIHMFWNMNSLVRCAWQSADGVSINLIKDPLDTSSYFAFVAKNGGNLTIVTDRPREAHPLSKYMTRRPEKDFTNRIFKNHFPYGLLDITVDREGYAHPGQRSLVPIQEKPIKIGTLSELEPDEIIWSVMMFSLIDEKLYKENYHCGELSYTSDMIENPRLGTDLLSIGNSGALMVQNYKPLEAPVIDLASLDGDEQYPKYSGSGLNNWLFERYKDQVPSDILNGLIPSDGSAFFLLPDGSRKVVPEEQTERSSWNQKLYLRADDVEYFDRPDGVRVYTGDRFVRDAVELKKMTGDEFGSAEDLMKDYRWFARYNTAKFIQQKACEEFTARKDDVNEWVRTHIEQNLERICKDILRYKYEGVKEAHGCQVALVPIAESDNIKTYDAYRFAKQRGRKPIYYTPATTGCWFAEDAPCSYLMRISPIDLKDLLYLVGCDNADELPDVLQNWRSNGWDGPTTGNHILDRVDPMDWVVKNPWGDLHFNVLIGIGKKHLSKVKKELGVDENSNLLDNNNWI